jgi:hypothetical protein
VIILGAWHRLNALADGTLFFDRSESQADNVLVVLAIMPLLPRALFISRCSSGERAFLLQRNLTG